MARDACVLRSLGYGAGQAHLADCSRASADASSPARRSSSTTRDACGAGSPEPAPAFSAVTAAAAAACDAGSTSCSGKENSQVQDWLHRPSW